MHYAKCTFCGCEYRVEPDFAGKTIKCQQCHKDFEVADLYEKQRKPSFEEIAIAYGVITKEQLKDAVLLQRKEAKEGNTLSLTDIFIKNDMMKPEQFSMLQDISKYLDLRLLDKQFGRIAIKKNMLTEKEIKLALSVQAINFKKNKYCRLIGDILIESGVMTTAQRDTILEEQKRIESALLKKEEVVDVEMDATMRKGMKERISNLKSLRFKDILTILSQKRSLIIIFTVMASIIGLFVYASIIKPQYYRHISKEGIVHTVLDANKEVYKYPFEFSTTLKDGAFFHFKIDILFYDIGGFQELDDKLDVLQHAFGMVFTPRDSSQIKSKARIVGTLRKILESQLELKIADVDVTDYTLTSSGEPIPLEKKSKMNFSF